MAEHKQEAIVGGQTGLSLQVIDRDLPCAVYVPPRPSAIFVENHTKGELHVVVELVCEPGRVHVYLKIDEVKRGV